MGAALKLHYDPVFITFSTFQLAPGENFSLALPCLCLSYLLGALIFLPLSERCFRYGFFSLARSLARSCVYCIFLPRERERERESRVLGKYVPDVPMCREAVCMGMFLADDAHQPRPGLSPGAPRRDTKGPIGAEK